MKSRTIVYLGLLMVTIVAASTILLQGTAVQTQPPRLINIKGSTTVLPIAQAAAEAWMDSHPNDRITIAGGGSGVGIAALIDGDCDIAISSRALKDEEKRAGLIEHEIALDAVCVIVNSTNPVNGLTLQEIKAIFKGDITNWSEVGGPNLEIAVYTRESTSGTYETFETRVMKPENITIRALTKTSNGEIVQAISGNPNGIGYVGIGYLANAANIKGLKINGIEPSVATVQSGAFPISRYLYMITKGQPEGLVKDFIEFVTSPSGQEIVEEYGFVKLP